MNATKFSLSYNIKNECNKYSKIEAEVSTDVKKTDHKKKEV